MARFLTEFQPQSNSQRFNLAKVGIKAIVPLSLQVRKSIIYQVMYSREDEAETNRLGGWVGKSLATKRIRERRSSDECFRNVVRGARV